MRNSDLPTVKSIIDDNQMFPSEYLDDMTSAYFSGKSPDHWAVVSDAKAEVLGVSFSSPERMTEGTWNMLLIAVTPRMQGRGIGSKLVEYVELKLRSKMARVLLVETSGTPEYELTRRFYPKCGYRQVALVPEYYDSGDDKVVFWKQLKN